MKLFQSLPNLKVTGGFTLIEVMLAAGISVGLALALATIMRNASQTETQIKVKQETYNLQQQLRYERTTSGPPTPDP